VLARLTTKTTGVVAGGGWLEEGHLVIPLHLVSPLQASPQVWLPSPFFTSPFHDTVSRQPWAIFKLINMQKVWSAAVLWIHRLNF
jgi:hypothetical protein